MRFIVILAICMLAFVHKASAACSLPSGAAGDVTYNTTYNVPMYCDDTNWIAMSSGIESSNWDAVRFDGGDYLLQEPAAVFADTNKVTGSFWFRSTATGVEKVLLRALPGNRISIEILSNNTFRLSFEDGNNGNDIFTATRTGLVDGNWHHVMFSFDNGLNLNHFYVDGTSYGITRDTVGNIPLSTATGYVVGAKTNTGTSPWVGDVFDLWLDFGTYIDLSVQANREKFRLNNQPVFLGADGSVPTGSQPEIFFSGAAQNWHVQKGTGGSYAQTGALEKATSPVANMTAVVPSGLIGHWRLDETSGTIAYDSSGNGNHGVITRPSAGTLGVPAKVNKGLATEEVSLGSGLYVTATGFPMGANPPFSVSMWIKRDKSINAIFRAGNVIYARRNLRIEGFNGTHNDTGADLPYNTWTHFVITYDGTNVKVYRNTELRRTYAGTITVSDASFIFGETGGAYGSAGTDFDDVRMYNRALTDSEIQEIYEAHNGIRYNDSYRIMEYFDGNQWVSMVPNGSPIEATVDVGLVGHWKLDEVSGTAIADSSGNGHVGTFNDPDLSSVTASGAVGNGLHLQNDDYVNLGNDTALKPALPLTFSAWVKVDNASTMDNTIITLSADPAKHIGAKMEIEGGQVGLMFGDGGGSSGGDRRSKVGGTIQSGIWYHVAGVIRGSTDMSIYVNGVDVGGSYSGSGSAIQYDTNPAKIGQIDATKQFKGVIDDVRLYNIALSASEIQDLYSLGSVIGSSTALPEGCPNIGDVCDDGTIYAGITPDGSVPMYALPTSSPAVLQWNESVFHTAYTNTAATSYVSGYDNTAVLIVTDADSSVAGIQKHKAAQYCADQTLGNNEDFYLPSQQEMDLLFASRDAIGGFVSSSYWSSSQTGANTAWSKNMGSGTPTHFTTKNNGHYVRCIRKGPAARCTNPSGLEGTLVYNTSANVMQYCDGARWIAIGKTN